LPQKIIVASGHGEDEMPSWPDISDYMSDVIQPFFMFVGTFAFSFGPGIAAFLWVSPLVGVPLVAVGIFFFPMAFLAVAMADTITAMNPLIVCSSILKIKGPYFAACAMLALLVCVSKALDWILGAISIPVLPWMIEGFLTLLFAIIQVRVLGLLYYTNRRALGWF